MNKVQLIGRICTDITFRSVGQNNTSCATFTLAVKRKFKDNNGEYQSDFISCVAWRQGAEFINNYFAKGSKLALCGTLQTRTYDDKDGKKVYVTEVIVDEAEFVESKQTQPKQEAPQPTAAEPTPEQKTEAPSIDEAVDFESLPFEI